MELETPSHPCVESCEGLGGCLLEHFLSGESWKLPSAWLCREGADEFCPGLHPKGAGKYILPPHVSSHPFGTSFLLSFTFPQACACKIPKFSPGPS